MSVLVPAIDSSAWRLAATGELGDSVYWEPGFEIVDEARGLLCMLEERDEAAVDWEALLAGLPLLAPLSEMAFPPTYDLSELESLDGFMVELKEPSVDAPGQTFHGIDVYVDTDLSEDLVAQFQVLSARLLALPSA